jgi:5-methylcytosine-specific restriction protein A
MSILEDLYPNNCTLVIDVLRQADIDTSDWTANDDPSRRNNWSFGKDGEPQVLFIWHDELYMDADRVCYDASMQEHAIELERKNTATTRSQAKRARQFHSRVTKAFFQKLPLRVALVDGTVGEDGVAKVKTRVLDNTKWYAHRRDNETASVLLVRGIELPSDFDPSNEFSNSNSTPSGTQQQSDDLAPPVHQEKGTATFARDSEVVRKAKQRANGLCEYCGERGFETSSGGFYLEGHHVIPLGCDGPDEVWNTVAICPDDHRRAHFGTSALTIRDELINFLSDAYPAAQILLREHARKMDSSGKATELIEEDFTS